MSDYELDVATQLHSGPHPIDDERREKNRQVYAMLKSTDAVPIDDIHKISDCDLIYRFLIAKKWDVDLTVKGLLGYIQFRTEYKLNDVLWDEFPAEALQLNSVFTGFDHEGHPVFVQKPDPTRMGLLLVKFPRDLLMRIHFKMMEQGRRLQRQYQTDRVTCVLDMALLSMSVLTNPSAMGFLKDMTHVDQTHYPENMRYMLICNGGWTFSSLFKLVKPWLDPRVQQKINFMAGGKGMVADMNRFVEPQYLTNDFEGTNAGLPLITDADVQALPRGQPPALLPNPYGAVAHAVSAAQEDCAATFPVPEEDL